MSDQGHAGAGERLNLLYDLRVSGPTFEVMAFLCLMEARRRLTVPHSSGFDLFLVNGRAFGRENLSQEEFDKRLHSVVLPCAGLVPSVKSTIVWDKRNKAARVDGVPVESIFAPTISVHPRNYSYAKYYTLPYQMFSTAGHIDMRCIENPPSALADARALANRLCGSEAPVVFTLRHDSTREDQSRNNSHFIQVAEQLAREHPVVVIPDTADVGPGIETDLPVAYEVALNVRLRAALNEVALANFVGNSGPHILMAMNKNCAYCMSDLGTSKKLNYKYFKKHERLAMDPKLSRIYARPDHCLDGFNPYAKSDHRQLWDFESLTFEKAMAFLTSL